MSEKHECPAGRHIVQIGGGWFHTDDSSNGGLNGSHCHADARCFPDGERKCGLKRATFEDEDGLYWHDCDDDHPHTRCHGALCPEKLRKEDMPERRCKHHWVRWLGDTPIFCKHCSAGWAECEAPSYDRRIRDIGPPKAQQRKAGEPNRRKHFAHEVWYGACLRCGYNSVNRRIATQDRRQKAQSAPAPDWPEKGEG